MHFQYVPYTWILLASAIISAGLGHYAWRHRAVPGAPSFALLMATTFVWSAANGLEMAGTDVATKTFWSNVQWTFFPFVPLCVLTLALDYAGEDRWLTRRNLALLLIQPALTIVVVWTNQFHGLLRYGVHLDANGPFPVLAKTYGPWSIAHFVYAYTLVALAAYVLIRYLRRELPIYRRQTRVLLLALLLPAVPNFLFITHLGPENRFDLTPAAFSVAGALLAWDLLGYRLFDIVPMARETVIESMSDAMIVLDAQGRIADVNAAAQQFLGQSASPAVGRPAIEFLGRWPELMSAALGSPPAQTDLVLDVAGRERSYSVHVSPLTDRRRRPAGRVVVLDDITELRRIETALRESERRYREPDSLPETVFEIDTAARLTFINRSGLEQFGFQEDELLQGLDFTRLLAPEDRERGRRELMSILAGQPARPLETMAMAGDGKRFPVVIFANRMLRHGLPIGLRGLLVDITAHKRREEDLRRYAAAVQARNEELDAFAHTVAHDLRSPLANVVGYAQVLISGYDSIPRDKVHNYLQVISNSAQKMSDIIQELLLLAELREQDVPLAPLDMASIVGGALQRSAYDIERSQATIILPSHWPVALGHAAWVEEVWANYISNALKYGGRPPRLEAGATILEDGRIRFWLQDNGAGLTEEEVARLFVPFTRLSQIRATGTGLGLSIVRRILEKLGGEVGVESQAGRGSLFSFTLPAASSECAGPAVPEPEEFTRPSQPAPP